MLYLSSSKLIELDSLTRTIGNFAGMSIMKACPTCQRQYPDATMKFCLDDGAALVEELAPTQFNSAAEATLHLPGNPAARATGRSPAAPRTVSFSGSPGPAAAGFGAAESSRQSRAGVGIWVVLGALIIAVGAIAVALILTFGNRRNEEVANQTNSAVSPTPVAAVPDSTPNGNEAVTRNESSTNSLINRPKESGTPAKTSTPKPAVESTPRPSPPEPSAPRGPVSGGVLNGKAVSLVKPAYPAIARSAQASGAVQVQVLIDENGNVISAHAVSGHPLLQSSAVAAARASKFSPTILSGQAVKVSGVIIYNFVAQ